MKFKITKTSNWNYAELVNIETLEDLRNLQINNPNNERCEELIIDFEEMTIEIYDNYRE